VTEQRVQQQIIRRLRECGVYVVKTVAASRAGTPDLLACIGGRFVGIEVKRPGKKATPLQELHLEEIRDAGGVAFIAHGFDEVLEQLRKEGIDLSALRDVHAGSADRKPITKDSVCPF